MLENASRNKIDLRISCENLLRTSVITMSAPYCIVLIQNRSNMELVEIGRSDTVLSVGKAAWGNSIIIDFNFELNQTIYFKIRDSEGNENRHLGKASIKFAELVSKGTVTLDLTKQGTIKIEAEKHGENNTMYEILLSGVHLKHRGICCFKNNPFLVLYKKVDESWAEIARTNCVKYTLNPRWNKIQINSRNMCNNDFSRAAFLSVYDRANSCDTMLTGYAETTFAELCQKSNEILLSYPNYLGKIMNTGRIRVEDIITKPIFSFVDYLKAGVEISCTVAIGFTDKVQDINNPASNHFLTNDAQNQYEKAILEIGAVLENYDSDKKFEVYAFGDNCKGSQETVNNFLNLKSNENTYIKGVSGILEAYHEGLKKIALSGPTSFHPIINEISKTIKNQDLQKKYNILLILTDGGIIDMPKAIQSIVEASRLPLSIIIVGVGNDSFACMKELDSDDKLLQDSFKNKAVRDIVQFVPFHKVSGDAATLAAGVLKEVPRQLVDYMDLINFTPESYSPSHPNILPTTVQPI